MKTACEYCIFATRLKNKKQRGCRLDRLDTFKEQEKAELQENGFYLIDGYCNTCRNVYWKEYKDNPKPNKLVDVVLKEATIKYDVLISIDDSDIEEVKDSILYARTLAIPPSNIVLTGALNEHNVKIATKFIDTPSCLENSEDKFAQSQKYINGTKSSYLLFVVPGVKFSVDAELIELNRKLNILLKPIHYINGGNYFLVSRFLYMLNVYEPNPIQSIIEKYEENGKPKSECIDSES
jgi:hypothetical protein